MPATTAATKAVNVQAEIPAVLQALIATQDAIGAQGLDRKLTHLVTLRASQINQCGFCVKMHIKEAREDGERNERLDRIIVWRHVSDFTPSEKAALAWTEALTVIDTAADLGPLRATLREHFTDRQIAALTATIAMINLWNRVQIAAH